MSRKLGFRVDLKSCIGCKACQVACKDKHQLAEGILWRRVVEVAGGAWTRPGETWQDDTYAYFVSVACMHCEQPICAEVCPDPCDESRREEWHRRHRRGSVHRVPLLRVGLPVRRAPVRPGGPRDDEVRSLSGRARRRTPARLRRRVPDARDRGRRLRQGAGDEPSALPPAARAPDRALYGSPSPPRRRASTGRRPPHRQRRGDLRCGRAVSNRGSRGPSSSSRC